VLQSIKSGANERLGEQTSNETAEYAEGFDAGAIKYQQHTTNDVTYAGYYRGLDCFGNREEQIQT
jgi:hypothetical protein